MIKQLAHICFTVSDLSASTAFYCDKLGFEHAFDFTTPEGRLYGVYLKAGPRLFIELFEGTPAPPPEAPSYKHCCLEVDDIRATVNDLRHRGAEVSDPKLGKDNSWQAWTADPDGNRIELHEYTAESRQTPWLDETRPPASRAQP